MLGDDRYSALKMFYSPGDVWTVTLDVSDDTRQLRYRYLVKENGEVTRVEQCACHMLSLSKGIAHYRVDDGWDDSEDGMVTDDFIKRLTGAMEESCHLQPQPGTVVIEALMPSHDPRMKPAVVGEAPSLGSWNVRHAVDMKPCGESMWRAELKMLADELPAQFKLILMGKRGEVKWESGGNRWLRQSPASKEVTLVRGLRFRHDGAVKPAVATWVELPTLRSDRGMGVGDLADLKKVIQWVSATGQNAVVVNSIADLTVVEDWMPVNVRKMILENAIDPIFVCAAALGSITDKKKLARYQKSGMAMNRLETAPIDEVRALKMDYCEAVYDDNGVSVTRSASYRKFVRDNGAWLRPYAAQCLLSRINGTSDSAAWGNYSRYNLEQLERFLKARHHEATFIFYLQYQLRQQLLTAARFASTKKIALLCDMSAPRHVKYLDVKEPWVNQRFIEQRLRQSGRMAMVPLRDWLLIDGDYLKRVAKCSIQRLPVSLEELVADHDFNTRVKSIMAPEKRTP